MIVPKWVEPIRYEYDVDMSTHCEQCMEDLKENQLVFKSKEFRNTYYCSEKCVQVADGCIRDC